MGKQLNTEGLDVLVAKLSNGKIVLVLKEAQEVRFSEFRHVLINDNLDARQQRWKPYWVLETTVVWMLRISKTSTN